MPVTDGGVGGGGAAAAAGGGAADVDELENPCPICLDNEDDADVDANKAGMCSACGQSYCGACNVPEKLGRITNIICTKCREECKGNVTGNHCGKPHPCPTCRAPLFVPDKEDVNRLQKLLRVRSPRRHTPVAQCNLGSKFYYGQGVKQSYKGALKLYQLAAEQGHAEAQCNRVRNRPCCTAH